MFSHECINLPHYLIIFVSSELLSAFSSFAQQNSCGPSATHSKGILSYAALDSMNSSEMCVHACTKVVLNTSITTLRRNIVLINMNCSPYVISRTVITSKSPFRCSVQGLFSVFLTFCECAVVVTRWMQKVGDTYIHTYINIHMLFAIG